MDRRPILAANWKMNMTRQEARSWAEAFLPLSTPNDAPAPRDVVVAPPATALDTLAAAFEGTPVALCAQNVHEAEHGAYTGEISPGMLADLGCGYCIVGHSERRSLFGESSARVAAKARALLAHGIRPIVCVGETLEERDAGRTESVVGGQLEESLSGVETDQIVQLVVAYEPVWAIGTGRTATPEQAEAVHGYIRSRLGEAYGAAAAQIRIQYGGSVKPENVAAIMAQENIDGALVGGASLDPVSFSKIVHFDRTE